MKLVVLAAKCLWFFCFLVYLYLLAVSWFEGPQFIFHVLIDGFTVVSCLLLMLFIWPGKVKKTAIRG